MWININYSKSDAMLATLLDDIISQALPSAYRHETEPDKNSCRCIVFNTMGKRKRRRRHRHRQRTARDEDNEGH